MSTDTSSTGPTASPASSPPPAVPPQRPVFGWPAAFATVAIMGLLMVIVVVRSCQSTASKAAANVSAIIATAADLFKPKVNVTTALFTSLESLKQESKLVVLTATLNVEILKQSEKDLSVFGKSVPLGTTSVRLRAAENKVQYYVPLKGLTTNQFTLDPLHRRIELKVPKPRLDQEVVEVQSDPAKLTLETDVGWARLDRQSGQALRDEARQELRNAVLREGANPLYLTQAKENARQALQDLLKPLAANLAEAVEIHITFEE